MEQCRYCEQPIHRIYPDADFDLGWAHTTRKAAEACPINRTGNRSGQRDADAKWPTPA